MPWAALVLSRGSPHAWSHAVGWSQRPQGILQTGREQKGDGDKAGELQGGCSMWSTAPQKLV